MQLKASIFESKLIGFIQANGGGLCQSQIQFS